MACFTGMLSYLCDSAYLAFVCGTVARCRQRALFNRTSTVQRNKGGSTKVKWIVGVIVQLVGISQSLLTGSQNLAGLGSKEIFIMVVKQ